MRNHQATESLRATGATSGHVPVWTHNPYTGGCLDVEPLFRFLKDRSYNVSDVAERLDKIAFMLIETADDQALADDPIAFKNAQGWAHDLRDLFHQLGTSQTPCAQ